MNLFYCSQVWFKNRRAKWRKQKREQEAAERRAGEVGSSSSSSSSLSAGLAGKSAANSSKLSTSGDEGEGDDSICVDEEDRDQCHQDEEDERVRMAAKERATEKRLSGEQGSTASNNFSPDSSLDLSQRKATPTGCYSPEVKVRCERSPLNYHPSADKAGGQNTKMLYPMASGQGARRPVSQEPETSSISAYSNDECSDAELSP